MKNNKNKKTKMRKLIPAIGMLAISATMLSTSTYAWFTMNKEVEVTGLQMQATTGDALEISLGKLGEDKPTNTTDVANNTYGSALDVSWKASVDIDEYYKFIAKLKPASSDTALQIYSTEDKGIFAAGTEVEDGTLVNKSGAMATTSLVLDSKYNTEALTSESNPEVSDYYVDIPMWIRTSNAEARDLKAWVEITDPDDTNGSDLINAVRVALIPVAHTDSLTNDTWGTYTQSAALTADATVATAATIFGLDSATYHGKVLGNGNAEGTTTAVDGSYTYGTLADPATVDALVTAPTIKDAVADFSTVDFTTGGTVIGTMPAAADDNFSAVLIVARVWLEGESTSCWDATANQDWNIQFHFALGDIPIP